MSTNTLPFKNDRSFLLDLSSVLYATFIIVFSFFILQIGLKNEKISLILSNFTLVQLLISFFFYIYSLSFLNFFFTVEKDKYILFRLIEITYCFLFLHYLFHTYIDNLFDSYFYLALTKTLFIFSLIIIIGNVFYNIIHTFLDKNIQLFKNISFIFLFILSFIVFFDLAGILDGSESNKNYNLVASFIFCFFIFYCNYNLRIKKRELSTILIYSIYFSFNLIGLIANIILLLK